MFICLSEFLFILHFVYFQIGKIKFCSKRRKTNVKFWKLSLKILTEIDVRSLILCVFGCFSVWLGEML
jgi:hypothetical protein